MAGRSLCPVWACLLTAKTSFVRRAPQTRTDVPYIMRLLLVRHGESEANVAQIISDDPARPVALTARGEAQARAVAEELRTIEFALAFASELPRARQTAAIILTHHACDLRIDRRLNERRSGMDGLPTHLFHELVAPDPVHVRPRLGESFLEEIERLRAFLSDLDALPAGLNVLAVSHEDPIQAARAVAGLDPRVAVSARLANCAMVTLERRAGRWHEPGQ